MRDELSDMDWDDLVDLIIEAPPERLLLAIRSGPAFDVALLRELRRLSVH